MLDSRTGAMWAYLLDLENLENLESTVQITAFTSDTKCKCIGFKGLLSFDESLEALLELTESCYTHGYGCYRERIQTKIS